jgi:hypothetical protein
MQSTTTSTTMTPTTGRRCARTVSRCVRFKDYLAGGGTSDPLIVGEAGDSVVVDPRPEPALPVGLHQIFTFRGRRLALIQDYSDAASAIADLT